jgi:hypothetical protein
MDRAPEERAIRPEKTACMGMAGWKLMVLEDLPLVTVHFGSELSAC